MRLAQLGGEYYFYSGNNIASIVEDSPGYYTVTGDFVSAGYTQYLTTIVGAYNNRFIAGLITAKSDTELSVMGYSKIQSSANYCYIYVAKGHAQSC